MILPKAMRPLFRLVIYRRYVSIDLGRHGGEIVTFELSCQDGSNGVGMLRAKLVLATSNSDFMHTRATVKAAPTVATESDRGDRARRAT